MQLLLLPLMGPLHLRYPALNAFTLRDVLVAHEPDLLATTALMPGELDTPSWQDNFELALPLAIVPWARAAGLPFETIGVPSPDPAAESDFRRYVTEMPALQEQLLQHGSLERSMGQLLQGQLNLRSMKQELLPVVREMELALLEVAGDGPATDWRWERAGQAVERLLEAARSSGSSRPALLAGLQDVPALERALNAAGVEPVGPPDQMAVSDRARARSLLDHALVTPDDADTPALLSALEQEGSAESGYARANLLLSSGRHEQALRLLETVAREDFSEPYFLPGWLLARLGQLRDLAGKRELARMAYRGVLALDWAPAEAVEAARAGLEQPFALPEPVVDSDDA